MVSIEHDQASARHTGLHAERIYSAAEQFVDRVLRRDDSLFTPGRAIWTQPNIDELYRRFIINEDTSSNSFIVKFERQLNAAAPEVIQLAAEMMFVHLLLATRNSITAATKRQLITTVLGWSPSPAGIPDDLFMALDHGLAAMGVAFGTYRPYQLGFLLDFVRRWKTLSEADQTRFLDDPWAFKQWLFAIPMHTAYAQREAILHIVHPDSFEAIVSRDHKQKIARAFASYVTTPTSDIDQQIAQIRQKLTPQYGAHFTFYRDELRNIWTAGGPVADPSDAPLSDALGPNLRPYVQLAMRLADPAYTPEEIVDRLGRTSPQIVSLPAAPNADDLVADMMLLRLLEPLPDRRYRRWGHLEAADEEDLLRYAALTLLLPVAGEADTYMLPIMHVPQDGQAYPAEVWPGGAGLLRWYKEAQLAEQSDNGWRLRPDALRPLDAARPVAQAINTFLEHLSRVQASHALSHLLEEDILPVLDPTTLEDRIAEIQRELLIDRRTVLRIYRSLIAGRHVILSGPPGTGKTHLARILPRILWRDETATTLSMPTRPELPPTAPPVAEPQQHHGYSVDVVTATEDWGTRHVIGGIVPQLQENGSGRTLVYGVRHGVLTRTLLQNYGGDGETIPEPTAMLRQQLQIGTRRYRGRWLVIDEFTRAPIDAAFGSLLTTLGGQTNPKLAVPTDAGVDRDVPLPRDFRLIGTLNSFDRHFLNQISEAMKRRFTFIDVLPPSRELSAIEQAMAIYRAMLSLSANNLPAVSADAEAGRASWTGVLTVRREETPDDALARVRYVVDIADPEARDVLDSFWRLFESIRVYRQLGTAQAEAVYATIFAGYSIGMSWTEALDSALADVLADQLQVLARDEQRVLVALIEHHDNVDTFAGAVKKLLTLMPAPRQRSHLAQLKSAGVATASTIDDSDSNKLQPDQLRELFRFDLPLNLPVNGLFARRMYAFINEKGL